MIFKAVTQDIEVCVEPDYCPDRSEPESGGYFWTYTITLTNQGATTTQLLTRHWEIVDEGGRVQNVDGPGVVGEQPVLAPGENFRYTSGVPLTTPSGMMRGRYGMQGEDGSRFDIDIPAFSLDSPYVNRSVN